MSSSEPEAGDVFDPVCGRAVAPGARGLPLLFRGRHWFFCDDAVSRCRQAFKRAPERWADAHPEAGVVVAVAPAAPPRTRAASPFRVTGAPLRVAADVTLDPPAGIAPAAPAGADPADDETR